MSDTITTFFEAWQIDDAESRREKIANAVTKDIQYDDPRTPESLTSIAALNDYVGMFQPIYQTPCVLERWSMPIYTLDMLWRHGLVFLRVLCKKCAVIEDFTNFK